jgi:glycosyltransferase involved in cell wall biosynthesis
VKIVAFPRDDSTYIESLYNAIEARGVEVVPGDWSGRWLLRHIGKDTVAHLHWPSFLYSDRGAWLSSLYFYLRFLVFVTILATRARAIWWTAHNLLPHERARWPIVDSIARMLVIRISDTVFVHGAEARREVVARFPAAERKCVQIPHGHWIDRYGPRLRRQDARSRLSLSQDAYVYLFFGQIRPYKNVELLIRAFLRCASNSDVLLVVGSVSDAEYRHRLESAAQADRRIALVAGFVPDNEVSAYLSAADVFCAPYSDILTSGAAMLAMSYGLPLVSIDKGFLREISTHETGVLIPPNDEAALAKAMTEMKSLNFDASQIVEEARRHSFDVAAEITVRQLDRYRD